MKVICFYEAKVFKPHIISYIFWYGLYLYKRGFPVGSRSYSVHKFSAQNLEAGTHSYKWSYTLLHNQAQHLSLSSQAGQR